MQTCRVIGRLVKRFRQTSVRRHHSIGRAQIGWPLLVSLPFFLSFDGTDKWQQRLNRYLDKPILALVRSAIMDDSADKGAAVSGATGVDSQSPSNKPVEPQDGNTSRSSERMESLQEHLSQRTAEYNEARDTEDIQVEPGSTEEGQPKTKVLKTDSKQEGVSAASEQPHKTKLFVDVEDHQWPIVYSPEYNIGFLGMEKLHPFDSGKWGKVFNFLREDGMLSEATSVRPLEATEADLLVVHSSSYINSLRWSITVAGITEVPPVALLPNFVVQKKVLKPLRTQTGGTILAAKLAMERGWAINVGGGFHHCSSERGGGFCAYADITLAIKFLLDLGLIKKAMIVDLDAHQGNGHARDFMEMMDTVYIMDVYNRNIYPHDGYAKRGIRRKVELDFFTADEEYLQKVKNHLKKALEEFQPDIIVYNAGTDCLEGDPLGALSITAEGIKKRDQLVFEFAKKDRDAPIPILMVTSGGYQRNNARIIADSILNLRQKGLIGCQAAEHHQAKFKRDTTTGGSSSSPEGATASSSSGASSPTSPDSGDSRRSFFGWFRR